MMGYLAAILITALVILIVGACITANHYAYARGLSDALHDPSWASRELKRRKGPRLVGWSGP